MKVDLLVCNYNTLGHLKNLLDTLHSDYKEGVWDLYIQDNGSTDGSAQWMKEHRKDYNIVEYIPTTNVGYSAAINNMASISDSEILAAVNADTWFTTKHVKQMRKTFKKNPNQAICGPKQMDAQGRIRHGGIFWDGPGTNPVHRGWSAYDPEDRLLKDRQKCWTVSGSMYYVRRSVWDALTNDPEYVEKIGAPGAFLPTPHYFEETFCSVFAQHRGYEVWYDGTVETVGHQWHASEAVGESSRKYFDISRQLYIEACDSLGIVHECQ